ncbi:hypothetical protein ACIRD9_08420 [Streptomyces violaceus]|uniref:hypothetical protein n=1 Tax=Streptomyces violaceus TaxID=1936 RepID=UPI00381BBEC0
MDAGIAEQVAHDLSQPVRGTRVLDHLQFVRAFGLRQGVRSTGWPAVDVASCLAAQIGATAARFVTGFGALCRLPDITRWAQTVAALLAPGGSSTWPSAIPSPMPWPKSSPAGGVTGFLKKRAP